MWKQRLADYEERSRDKLASATAAAENTAEIKQQIATGQGASAERLSQAQIEAEQGRSVSQISVDLGLPGIKETTRLAGAGVRRLGLRMTGRINTKQMFGFEPVEATSGSPSDAEGVTQKPMYTRSRVAPEPQEPQEEEPEIDPAVPSLTEGVDITAESLQEPKTLSTEMLEPKTPSTEMVEPAVTPELSELSEEGIEKGTAALAKNVGIDASAAATEEGVTAGIGSLISDLAVPIGWGLGIYGAYETIKDIVKGGKEYSAAVAKAKGQIANVNSQIAGLQTQVSADQFESKVGASKPSFGSLAATPSIDTSKQVSPALSF